MSLQRIDLEAQREYAYHGCMEEERIIGSEYRIDLSVWADLSASALSDELADTVDYVALRIIVSEEMRQRSKLLETVVHRITQRIFREHPNVARSEIKVCKLNPPIDGDVHAVCVSFFEENPVYAGKAL
jgi:7,8-dihydroneopterin aldolase/epimerase/oxygenase